MQRYLLGFHLGALLGATLLVADPAISQELSEKLLPLNGSISADGRRVDLDWLHSPRAHSGVIKLERRQLGEVGAESWKQLGSVQSARFRITDNSTEPGVAYEYRVQRIGRKILDVGYWVTGVDVPADETLRNAHIIVDETIAEALGPWLLRFERDLIGTGWQVSKYLTERHDRQRPRKNFERAVAIRSWLRKQYSDDPFGEHAIILIGHVPLLSSGQVGPDGHKIEPHATDLFYADMDGQWRVSRDGVLGENQVPSSNIEMQVGRIDFATVSQGKKSEEISLLRSYFDKNHHWRMGLLGELRGAYGQSNHLFAERYGLRNLVGPKFVVEGGHHDTGTERPWLWGVDFGSWDPAKYREGQKTKAVFLINFGSGKQKIDRHNNTMTALLAHPWYPLAVGWGGRPAWWLHLMSLGGSIGEVHKRTVNNGKASEAYRESLEYFPTGRYLWRNPIWVNLLGDPTMHAFVLKAPNGLSAKFKEDGVVELTWRASSDPGVIGYNIYRSLGDTLTFEQINAYQPVVLTTFIDDSPNKNAMYMVRAYGKKEVYAGSFYTLSQGIFSQVGSVPVAAEKISLMTAPGEPVALPNNFSDMRQKFLYSLIEPPQEGELELKDQVWYYTPPLDFQGEVALRYSIFDGQQTAEGNIVVVVTQ